VKISAVLIGILALVLAAHSESKDCLNPGLMVTDGRIVTSQFEASFNGFNPTYWYGFYGQAGHSYSVEFVPTVDNEISNTSVHLFNLVLWGPNDVPVLQQNGCHGPSTLSYATTARYSPTLARDVYGSGLRVSLVQPVSGLTVLSVSNNQDKGLYSYRVVDTTLFNARWSTYSGYDTQWGFTNTSDMNITGTLSISESSNRLLTTVQITVPPGGQAYRMSNHSDLNLPRNDSGYAIFSNNGPPQAILGDSYMLNGPATVVVYTKFETRNTL